MNVSKRGRGKVRPRCVLFPVPYVGGRITKGENMTNALEKRIDALAKKASALMSETHCLAVEVLNHAAQHGDVTLIERLFKALPKGFDRSAFLTWLYAYSPVRTSGDQSKWGLLKEGAKGFVAFNIEGADATPFWGYAKKPEAQQMDYAKILQMVVRLEKRLEKIADGKEEVAEGTDLAKVAALRDRIAAIVPEAMAGVQ